MDTRPNPLVCRPGRRAAALALVCGLACCGPLAGCASTRGASGASVSGQAPDAVAMSQARESAFAVLEELAAHPDPVIRANALEGMLDAPGRADRWLERGLMDQSAGVRAVALMGIARGSRAHLAEQAQPLLGDRSRYVRLSAIYALAANGRSPRLEPLARALMDTDEPRLRAHAAVILGEMGNASALPMLRRAAQRSSPMAPRGQVRLLSLQLSEAMVKLGDQEQVQAIRAALYPARPEELEATALAARILGDLGDKGAIDQLALLTARLDNRGNLLPPEVRLSAVQALARLGRPQGDFIAREYLDDERAQVRALAALSLGETGQARYLDRLTRMMHQGQPVVRVHAASAVVRLTRP